MENNRGKWSGSLMFVLAAIGSAIGMGNLWGFPYKMGANGGLPFLLIYLALVVLCGVVVMSVEMAIGRKTGKSPIEALSTIGKKYKFVGWFGTLSAFIIMGFYSVIMAYALRELFGYAAQLFLGLDGFGGITEGWEFFGAFTSDVPGIIIYTGLVFAICYYFVARGTEGLEKFNKVGIPGLFLILIGIIIYNFTLPGWQDGYVFMFTTKGLEMTGGTFNFFKAVRTAGGQMLFSLSLGMGAMITYGSYLGKNESIAKNAWIIPAFDTLAAIFAGMAIFPAVFATGTPVNAGPSLLFATMFNVFKTMGSVGNLIGVLFNVVLLFAGVSSAISLMEVVTSSFIDMRTEKGKTSDRKKVSLLVTLAMFAIAIVTCVDQFGGEGSPFLGLYGFLGEGSKDMLDLLDMLSEGIMMPLGAAIMCLIIGWKTKFSWMVDEVTADGKKWKMQKFFEICVKFVTPVLMLFVFVSLFLSYLGI